MLSFTILFLILVTLFIFYLKNFAKERPENFPPGPPKLPIWGSYWLLLKENYSLMHLALQSLGKRYKTDILGLFLGEAPTVVTLSNKLTKEMLSREEFIGKIDTIVTQARSRGITKGIFFTDGPIWKTHRRFSLRHLRDYGFGRRSDVMENYTTDEIKYIMNLLSTEPKKEDLEVCKTKGVVLVPDFLYGSLINLVMLVLSSTQFDHQRVRPIAKAALRFLKSGDAMGGALTITPWLRHIAPNFFGYTSVVRDNGILLDWIKEIVDEHLRTFSDDHHRDFIDDYISENIKQGTELDYSQLSLVILDYMFPSPIAIGHTLSFLFAYLINNSHIQLKIHEELDRVVGRHRLPNLDDRKNLPYLEASIRETIRILPITPLGLPRRCVEDTTLGGYFIPKNTVMIPNLWSAHRDESVFSNPEKFQPERFLNDDGTLMKTDYTIGFSAGKRLCAGETYARHTMFSIMSSLLQNFTFESSVGKPIDLNSLEPGISLSFKNKMWITAVPRQ